MMNTPADAHRRGFDPKEIEGRTVDAKYDVHELINTGGMGAIYRALDTEMGRMVALKAIVAPRSAMSEMDIERVQRFKRECKGLAQMEHENIVTVYDTGVDEETLHSYDIYYIAMELMEGKTLEVRLAELEANNDSMSWEEILEVIQDVASALDYAHEHELHFVHRDVKPGNIMLSGDRACLFDFGLLKALNVPTEGTKQRILAELGTLTRAGVTLGTPAYWSPEQISGGEVDRRTDVYALGGVLHHMLTGRPPYPAEDFVGLSAQHLHEPPPRPSSVNLALRAFDPIVNQAMKKEPDERYPTAGALAHDLKNTVKRTPDPARGRREAAAHDTARRVLWGLGGVTMFLAVVAFLIGIGVKYWNWFQPSTGLPPGWRSSAQGVSMKEMEDRTYEVTVNARDASYVLLKEGMKLQSPHTAMEGELASGPPETAYGIVFQYIDDANYYVLAVTGSGQVGVWQRKDGRWCVLPEMDPAWASRKYVHTDQPNRLEVTVENGKARVEVNYQPVFEDGIELGTTRPGNVGILVSTSKSDPDPKATVRFDFILRK